MLNSEKSSKQITFELLDEMGDGTVFKGIELQKSVHAITGRIHYPSTMLKYLRIYRAETTRNIKCIDRHRSIYHIQPSDRVEV